MSFDRKIDWVCPHMVVEEALFLSSDRVTIKPLRPIGSVASLRVRLDGEVFVPPMGIHLPASALGNKGPFTVRAPDNTLVLSVNDGADQTVTLPLGEALTASTLATGFNTGAQSVLADVTPRGRFRLSTKAKGSNATLMLKSSSNLAQTLGLPVLRQWRGRTAVPGWSVVNDPNTLPDRPTRLVVFDAPLLGFKEFVELNYVTIRQECRRCGGLGVEHDWRYTPHGNTVEARYEALLIQENSKIAYTYRGSNPFHLWYGTSIFEMIATKMGSRGLAQNLITKDLQEAFRNWQSIKKQQEEVVGQFVSDEEYPFQILGVAFTGSPDPTVVFVTATIQNRSQKPIQISRGISVPQPDNLLSSTAQEGVFRQSLTQFTLTE